MHLTEEEYGIAMRELAKSEGKTKKFPDMKATERRQACGKMGAKKSTAGKVTMLKKSIADVTSFAQSRGTFRSRDVCEAFELSEGFARRVLRELYNRGVIQVHKKTREGANIWKATNR